MAFERLDVYQQSLHVARWLAKQAFPRGWSDLRTQAHRASASVVLNTAEGLSRRGKSRRYHLEIARGSAAETLAVLALAELPGWLEQAERLRRVDRMLERLGG